jgi:xanthine dehydrogenase accessory factor
MPGKVLIRGGGEMATGVASVLHRAGFAVAMTECARPRAIRRSVAFAEAVVSGRTTVEEITACVTDASGVEAAWARGEVPVVVDPDLGLRAAIDFAILVDAILSKSNAGRTDRNLAPLVIGLGPGFVAPENCHLVVETNRGHHLGRFYDRGPAEPNTGSPGELGGQTAARVLRAPAAGPLEPGAAIGEHVQEGQVLATVSGKPVTAPFTGVLRGLMAAGTEVAAGEKIGDVDPRDRPEFCRLISDKARLIGLGVLSAILWWENGRLLPLPPNPNLAR